MVAPQEDVDDVPARRDRQRDRKSTRLNSSHGYISHAVFCLKKKQEADRSGRQLLRASTESRQCPQLPRCPLDDPITRGALPPDQPPASARPPSGLDSACPEA